MARFISVSQIMQDDYQYLKDVLEDSRATLRKRDSYYYAVIMGESKNKNIAAEIEGELASLGVYIIDTVIYWEPGYRG